MTLYCLYTGKIGNGLQLWHRPSQPGLVSAADLPSFERSLPTRITHSVVPCKHDLMHAGLALAYSVKLAQC